MRVVPIACQTRHIEDAAVCYFACSANLLRNGWRETLWIIAAMLLLLAGSQAQAFAAEVFIYAANVIINFGANGGLDIRHYGLASLVMLAACITVVIVAR